MSDIKINAEKDKTKAFKLKLMRGLTVFLIVLIFLIIALIIYMVSSQAKGKVPFVGKVAWLRIETPSMEDTLPVGSFILIKKASPKDIKVGDIITFYSDDPSIKGLPNTHRVVDIETSDGKTLFTTKGDNNQLVDKYKVSEDKVIGIYVRKMSVLSSISNLFRSKAAFLLLIIPAVILVLVSAKDVFSAAKAAKKEKISEEMIKAEVERLKKEAENNNTDNENNQK